MFKPGKQEHVKYEDHLFLLVSYKPTLASNMNLDVTAFKVEFLGDSVNSSQAYGV